VKGTQTEMGLKRLFMANSEDHLLLSFSSEKLRQLGREEEAKMISEKALVELGHARGILEKMIKYMGIESVKEWLEEICKKDKFESLHEEFIFYSTRYLLSKLLSEKESDYNERKRLEEEASKYYSRANETFLKLLESGEKLT
jgi:hypothetical protein